MNSARLIIDSAWCKQRVVTLSKPGTRIGRTPDNDVVFTHQCVSRSHATITWQNDHFVIEDLLSKHGTFVNRQPITRHALKHRDVIHLGLVRETEMLFLFDETSETDAEGLRISTIIPEKSGDFQAHDLEMLLEISRVMNSTLVLQDVLNVVMDAAIQLTKAQHGFLMLVDENDQLQFTVARNMQKESLEHKEFKISRTIVSRVRESGEPLISSNIHEEENLKSLQSVLDLNLQAVMCVPLKLATTRGGPRVIGVIYVHNQVVSSLFSGKTLELLESLASHAAIAIENAKLHEETRVKERMQKELEIAFEIQSSLLPQTFPSVTGVQLFARTLPASRVGGDFYHVIALGDRRIGIAIGDVIGKGVPAALYMSATLSIHETVLALRKDLPPRDVMATINQLLCRKTQGSRFVTFMYGTLDLDLRKFVFSNAGHSYPLLLRRGQCTELVCNGPALGMFDEDNFESATIDLEENDTLVLFTDGVIETMNADREMFGFERFIDLVKTVPTASITQFGNRLLAGISDFRKDTPQFDDLTLLCLKLTAMPDEADGM